jgi:cyclase
VRYIIHTEPHSDHVLGDYLFSPPALVIAHAGATASLKQAGLDGPTFVEKRAAGSADLRSAFQGYRMVAPQLEYRDRMTLSVGERTLELYYLKNVHSEADTAIWLPKERVLFTAASVGVKRFGNHRPLVSIPDTLSGIKMMRALNPEVAIPGHGDPGSVKMLDDMASYYNQLMDGVTAMHKAGKSLDQIKKELKIARTEDWEGQERFPTNIEAAYRAVAAK